MLETPPRGSCDELEEDQGSAETIKIKNQTFINIIQTFYSRAGENLPDMRGHEPAKTGAIK